MDANAELEISHLIGEIIPEGLPLCTTMTAFLATFEQDIISVLEYRDPLETVFLNEEMFLFLDYISKYENETELIHSVVDSILKVCGVN